jgi:methylphosphotriester-DNA--protein-cysteine methyltransferase
MKTKFISILLATVFFLTSSAIPIHSDDSAKVAPAANASKSTVAAVSDNVYSDEDHNGDRTVTSAAKKKQYAASKKSNVFHYRWCRYVKQIKSKNLVYYSKRNQAKKAGKRPCKVCRP